ncbi:MAG TPA: hypothetical protein VF765_22965 [Polyangiaceae bacterium]
MRKIARSLSIAAVIGLVGATSSHEARADDTIKRPGDHPHYSVELEPHALLGWAAQWAGTGFGLGGRVSIAITHDGFVKSINNSVAISLGLDWVHYGGTGCYYDPRYAGYCYGPGYFGSADFIQIPIVMQWNFYVAEKWSVFGEPGLYIWHGFFPSPNYPCNGPGLPPCGFYNYGYGNDTGVGPAFWAGGRFHFSDSAALTMRVGYPDLLTLGVSFFL